MGTKMKYNKMYKTILPQFPVLELEVAIPRRIISNRPMMMVEYPMASYIRILPLYGFMYSEHILIVLSNSLKVTSRCFKLESSNL